MQGLTSLQALDDLLSDLNNRLARSINTMIGRLLVQGMASLEQLANFLQFIQRGQRGPLLGTALVLLQSLGNGLRIAVEPKTRPRGTNDGSIDVP